MASRRDLYRGLVGDGRERRQSRFAGACCQARRQTAPVLASLESVTKLHADALAQLDARRKRLEDIRLELARTFEHEGRLADLLVRQRELPKQLDLDKDEAGSTKVDAEEARQAA